ncbi:hypothetical protein BDR06DRAFT_979255 [Suillus hirtellus]|nr:hypothetical protein BDR06DRAFT_979255 [Suillus hirtellus]
MLLSKFILITSIPCGHPCELKEAIPATLLHPVFGQFINDSKTHTIMENDNNLVYELANAMSAIYENKTQQVEKVSQVLSRYNLGIRLTSKVQGTSYLMDADMYLEVQNNLHCFVIAEFKNKEATSSSEPYMQALLYYLESMRVSTPRMSGFALPCFLLIIFGPYIVFAGAVWTLRPAVQILSNPLVFNYHSMDTDNQVAAACHMAAFCTAVRSLERYYEMLPPESELCNRLSHPILFPYPTSFISLNDNSKKNFNYTEHLEEDEGKLKRLIFFGTLTEGHAKVAICIKFVRCYSPDAHLHCAVSGLPEGWYMVVIDEIVRYDVLADLPNTDLLPQLIFQAIREQLNTLHACQLVHGNIRDTNILVKKDDLTKFMIIDFNWAGIEEVMCYPSYVNYTQINRPHGARDGLLIKAAHDHVMLNFIIEVRAEK